MQTIKLRESLYSDVYEDTLPENAIIIVFDNIMPVGFIVHERQGWIIKTTLSLELTGYEKSRGDLIRKAMNSWSNFQFKNINNI